MILPVISESGEVVEWGLVELQGKIEQQLEFDSSKPMPVGTIQISPTNKDVVQLIIGYHMLEGKKVPFRKPMAIMEKEKDTQGAEEGCRYKVVGVLRHKYLFKTRAKALISKPAGRR